VRGLTSCTSLATSPGLLSAGRTPSLGRTFIEVPPSPGFTTNRSSSLRLDDSIASIAIKLSPHANAHCVGLLGEHKQVQKLISEVERVCWQVCCIK
jgi:hypothetical protein